MPDPILNGAVARSAFYRPPRKRIRDLFASDSACVFVFEGVEHQVLDLSASGFLFASPNGKVWNPGSEIQGQLLLHGEPILDSTVRVARIQPTPAGSKVGVQAGTTIDLDHLLERDAERTFSSALESGPSAAYDVLPKGYVDAVGAIKDFLLYYKPLLDKEEARLRGKPDSSNQLHRLAERSFVTLKDRWRDLIQTASREGWELRNNGAAHAAAKRYTEATITPLLQGCPLIHRTWNKPLGYAGDYVVMEYYYKDDFEGATVFDQLMHKLFVQNPMAQGVVSRARFMVDLANEEHERVASQGNQEFAIANLGCGPGREVEMWAASERNPGPVTWTLIDQEEDALELAYQLGHEAVRETGRQAELKLLHISFAKLLRHPDAFAFQDQNFIFSSGLFDYLREERAQAIARALYERLVPGGLLAIGNAIGPNANLWPPEFVADWPILYRSRDDMEAMAGLLPKDAESEIVVEPGGAYYFLLVRKA